MFFAPLLVLASSFSWACVWQDKPFETKVKSPIKIIADARQEIILNGETDLPKIISIKPVDAGSVKPQLKVISGLQVLENGQMRSYPNKISVRLSEAEIAKTPLAIEIQFKGQKPIKMQIEYVGLQKGGGCTDPEVEPL